MGVQTLKLAGRDFVVIPKKEYEQMRAQLSSLRAQERGDIAEARRRAKEPSAPLAEVRKRYGR